MINKITPSIKKISFPLKGKMKLDLFDEREITIPLKYFPEIKKFSPCKEKSGMSLMNKMFSLDDCREVFQIEQILGKENNYRYNFGKKTA